MTGGGAAATVGIWVVAVASGTWSGVAQPEQIGRDLGPTRVPARRIAVEQALDDRVEPGRDPGRGGGRRDGAVVELALRDRAHVVTGERRHARRGLVEDRAERVEVAPRVGRLTLELLGSLVERVRDGVAERGEARRSRCRSR